VKTADGVFSPVCLWTPESRRPEGISIAPDKLSRFCLAYIFVRNNDLAPDDIKDTFSALVAMGTKSELGVKAVEGEGCNWQKASRLAKKKRVEEKSASESE